MTPEIEEMPENTFFACDMAHKNEVCSRWWFKTVFYQISLCDECFRDLGKAIQKACNKEKKDEFG